MMGGVMLGGQWRGASCWEGSDGGSAGDEDGAEFADVDGWGVG